jgi:hypothetical protein
MQQQQTQENNDSNNNSNSSFRSVRSSRENSVRQSLSTRAILNSAQGTPAVSLRRANTQAENNIPLSTDSIPMISGIVNTAGTLDTSTHMHGSIATVNTSATITSASTAGLQVLLDADHTTGADLITEYRYSDGFVSSSLSRRSASLNSRRKDEDEVPREVVLIETNMFHLLHKTNADLWRHVISFL